MTNWDYYESVQRFQRILEAEGISDALKEVCISVRSLHHSSTPPYLTYLTQAGAQQGDLVMIGDWDFNYWERKNRWIADLGLENINPRRRPSQEDVEQ